MKSWLCLVSLIVAIPGLTAAQTRVRGMLETRDYEVDVDTVRFFWGTIPDQVFYPDWGGPPGVTDSVTFVLPGFPPNLELYYQVDGGNVPPETIFSIVPDSWYLLPVPTTSQPRVKFRELSGIEERTGGPVLRSVACMPNPFVNHTVVRCCADASVRVSGAVYDACGNLVRVLRPAAASQTVMMFVWDGCGHSGRELPAGIYICRLRSGPISSSLRLVKLTGR